MLIYLFKIILRIKKQKEFIVLNYHQISGKTFKKQIEFLMKLFEVVTIDEFKQYYKHNNNRPTKDRLLLTFDDGYHDFYTEVYPVLKRHNLQATVFIPTDLISQNKIIWTDYLKIIILRSNNNIIMTKNKKYLVKNNQDKYKCYNFLIKKLKKMPNNDRLEEIDYLIKNNKSDDEICKNYQLLNWKQIDEMSKNNIIFGSHSHTHPILSSLNTKEMENEIILSNNFIKDKLGVQNEIFAYPNGKKSDYTKDTITHLEKAGIKYAFTTNQSAVERGESRYEINRVMLFEKHSLPEILVKITWMLLKK